jgi:hypothetical protein
MDPYNERCPFCSRSILVSDVSTVRQAAHGLVYLVAKCHTCDARIEASGVDTMDAKATMATNIHKRIGTRPEQWKIRQVRRVGGKWTRRMVKK